jgi:CRP-like cAMP-binding protein
MNGTSERAGPGVVRLLEVDGDLAATIPEGEREAARSAIVARVELLEAGQWDGGPAEPDHAGLLVTAGLLSRDVSFGGQSSRELLGPGDVLRPWDVEQDFLPPYSAAGWTVYEPTTVAMLDSALLRLGGRWPQLVEELIRRTMHRSRWLAIRLAITGATRVDDRLLLFLWHAAGRWGRITPEGAQVSLPLTHEDLAVLVGARRPSVSTALTQLRERGEIEQRDGGWILLGRPPTEIQTDT